MLAAGEGIEEKLFGEDFTKKRKIFIPPSLYYFFSEERENMRIYGRKSSTITGYGVRNIFDDKRFIYYTSFFLEKGEEEVSQLLLIIIFVRKKSIVTAY